MTIDFSPYELVARADGRRREGSLLRVTFADGVRGYADLHPWPEMGDAPLDRQLASLVRREPARIAARSLALARVDGEARAKDRSLFEGLVVPPSHASLPYGFAEADLARARAEGYERVKLKDGDFSADDLAVFRASGLRFRLDFNARLSFEDVWRRLDAWGDLGWIDWLEDPCPYDPLAWKRLRSRVRVAIDFEEGDAGFDVKVVKPARDAVDRVPLAARNEREEEVHSPSIIRHSPGLAFTSYLDHPVGQLGAAWTAARAVADGLPVESGGLVTHEAYEPNAFSERLTVEHGRLVPPGGSGLGFARELEAREWRRLKG